MRRVAYRAASQAATANPIALADPFSKGMPYTLSLPRLASGIGYRPRQPTWSDAMDEDSDEELMLRYGAGEDAAFAVLYARHRVRLLRYLARLVGNQAVAEELYQDTWERVIAARGRYRPSARFLAWIFRIAHHLAIDRLRRAQATVDAEEALLDFPSRPGDDPALGLDDEQRRRRLLECIDRLPPEQRSVLLLRAEGELTLEEIAANLGTGRETIKSRLRYALAKLRAALGSS
jgi:RNA polymerase sigma-70 factor (ECF subfamily)